MRVLRIAHSSVVAPWRDREAEMRRLGVDVTVACAAAWEEGGRLVTFRRRPDEPAGSVIPLRTYGSHPNLFLYAPLALARVLRLPHDVLDLGEEPFSAAAIEVLALRALVGRRRPMTVISAQNIEKRYPPPFRWSERLTLSAAAGGYVCNRPAAQIVRTRGMRGPIVDLGLGVPAPPDDLPERDPPSGRLRVLGVGRITRHKGFHVAVEALAADPRLTLELVGDGDARSDLERLARDLGVADRVTFHGAVPPEDVPAHLARADVLAVPSLDTASWCEQFCRVAVEAMAAGVPVVASDGGALPEVVADAGIVVPQGDPSRLAAALGDLLEDPAAWSDLRRRGLERAGRYSWPRIAAGHVDLYRRALAPASPPDPRAPGRRALHVVVVAYGATDLLEAALTPLAASFPVTVVDNGSDPGARVVVDGLGGTYIDPGANLGFAAAVNRALAGLALEETDVLLLNPDARIDAGTVAALAAGLRSAPDLAAVAPSQVHPDSGSPDRVAWPFPSPARMWLDALGLGRLAARDDFVIGSVLLLRGEALLDIGGFDERFFLYDEEIDWQRRAARRGWRSRIEPGLVATHLGAGTDSDQRRREIRFHAGTEVYLRKWYGRAGWQVARIGMLAGTAVRSVVLTGPRRAVARERLGILLRGPLRAARRTAAVPVHSPHIPEFGAVPP